MARKPRVHVPGGLYHVILRGNAGQPIFAASADHQHLEVLVAEGLRRFGHRVHAYCWMPNHIHLLLQVGAVALPRILQNLAFRYTRWVNRKLHRRGHLFQGRYQAILVDADRYLLQLVRYIHLNPVRIGMVTDPVAYAHSSHRAYVGVKEVPWLTTNWVLGQFSSSVAVARRRYRTFMEAGLAEGHQSALYGGAADRRILGDDRFVESVRRQTRKALLARVPLERIVAVASAALGIEPEHLSSASRARVPARARALLAYVVVEHGYGTLTALTRVLHRDLATLSNGARAIRDRLPEDPALRARIQRITDALQQDDKITKA